MKQISQHLLLKALIMSTVPLYIQSKVTSKSALSFVGNMGGSRHLVSSLRTAPTAKKGALAVLGFIAGIYLHKEQYDGENEEISKEALGHFLGAPFGLFDSNILIKYPFVDTLAVFAGGMALGQSFKALADVHRAKALKAEAKYFDEWAKEQIAQKNDVKVLP